MNIKKYIEKEDTNLILDKYLIYYPLEIKNKEKIYLFLESIRNTKFNKGKSSWLVSMKSSKDPLDTSDYYTFVGLHEDKKTIYIDFACIEDLIFNEFEEETFEKYKEDEVFIRYINFMMFFGYSIEERETKILDIISKTKDFKKR